MATKKIEIIYNIDGKAIDVAIDKTLNLKQTVRELTKELNKTGQSAQNIQILSKSLNDAKDKMQGVKAKSSEFFNTLSLLPGPIGAFSNSIDGAIGLLKTFSSFKLSDIKSQFKGLGEDIMGIVNALLGLSNESIDVSTSINETQKSIQKVDETNKSTTQSTNDLSNATKTGSEVLNNNTTVAGTNTAATIRSGQALQDFADKMAISSTEINLNSKNINNLATKQNAYIETIPRMVDGVEKQIVGVRESGKAFRALEQSELGAVMSGKELTITSNGLIKAMYGATIAGRALGGAMEFVGFSFKAAAIAVGIFEAALAAIGIGLVISGIVALGSALVDGVKSLRFWKSNAELLTEENEKLAQSFSLLKKSINDTQDAIKDQTDLLILQAKIAGQSEKQIQDIQLKGYSDRLEALKQANKDLLVEQGRITTAVYVSEEEKQKKIKENSDFIIETNRKESELRIEIAKYLYGQELKIAENKRTEQKKIQEKSLSDIKEFRDKQLADNRTADEALLKLLQETSVLFIKDKRAREDEELKIAMENEVRIIDKLKISEEKKGIIRLQIFVKYGLKVLDVNNKRLDEDLKSQEDEAKQLRDFNKKKQEILDSATTEQIEKLKNQRKTKYQDDLMALEKDKEFIKLAEDEKKKLRDALRAAYDNDVKKIDDDEKKRLSDERLKKIDEELRYLQLKGETIRQGSKEMYDLMFEELKLQEQREIEAAEGKEKEITRIQDEYAKKRKKLKEDENIATIAAVGETIQALGNVTAALASNYDVEAKTSKDAFEKRKKLQLATAYMSAASGVIQILTQPSTLPSPFDWIVKGVNAAALLIATNASIKQIKATKFEGGSGSKTSSGKNQEKGGYIDGPRHSSPEGGVPIMAEGGEAVMTRGAVTMFHPLLSMMNQAGGGTSFTKGAVGSASFDNPQTQMNQMEQPIIKTYVVESELTTIQHRTARLKDLSTL